jgi:hypothetical protein
MIPRFHRVVVEVQRRYWDPPSHIPASTTDGPGLADHAVPRRPVVTLALEKPLFRNVPRKRPVVTLLGKKLCDINKRLDPF